MICIFSYLSETSFCLGQFSFYYQICLEETVFWRANQIRLITNENTYLNDVELNDKFFSSYFLVDSPLFYHSCWDAKINLIFYHKYRTT